ncbi:MAG: T9SS type A sorting domain-containing protein [Ignavibacteria bacterium]|nr:T9SS type A sorting domain-containing protein [Ignavibacteria bacterium]
MRGKPEKRVNFINAKAFYVALLLIVILCDTSFGQSITWQRTYDGPYNYVEECHTLCQSTDGNFFALGFSYDSVLSLNDLVLVMKVNPYGDTLWSKIIPNLYNKTVTASTPTPDGGCVFTGNGDTAYAVKIDINGNVVWRRNYGIQSFQIFDIVKTPDDSYLLSGSKLLNDWFGLLIKIDTSGILIWQNNYFAGDFRSFNSIAIANDSNYLLAGFVTDTFIDTQHIQVTKINTSGSVTWEKRYLVEGAGGNARRIIKKLNGYLLTGTSSFGKSFLSKINENGEQYFSCIFNTNQEEANWDTKILNENRYVLTMTRDSTPQLRNSRVIISDSSGNIIKDKVFRVPSSTGIIWLESILPQANGDIIFGGFSELYNDSTDFFLTRTDSLLYVPPIAIINSNSQIPKTFYVSEPYPNPFNPTTNIKYEIPRDANVSIKIYDLLGREVFNINEYKTAGSYQVMFDGSNLASGLYFYSLEASPSTGSGRGYFETKKMVLIK